LNDISTLESNLCVFAKTISANLVQFSYLNRNNQFVHIYDWNPNQSLLSGQMLNFSKARLHVIPSGADSMYVFIWVPYILYNDPNQPALANGRLFIARGSLNTTDNDEQLIPDQEAQPYISCNPNPFTKNITLHFYQPRKSYISIRIYNVKGELIRTLISETKNVGTYNISWNGKDDKGKLVSSGIYYYSYIANRKNLTGKLALIK
jgi:hypothetical protein